jgi:hypothetical protein
MKDCWLSLAHPPKPCRKCWIRCFVFAGAAGLSGRCPVVLLAERIEFAFELRREPAGCDGVEKSVLAPNSLTCARERHDPGYDRERLCSEKENAPSNLAGVLVSTSPGLPFG